MAISLSGLNSDPHFVSGYGTTGSYGTAGSSFVSNTFDIMGTTTTLQDRLLNQLSEHERRQIEAQDARRREHYQLQVNSPWRIIRETGPIAAPTPSPDQEESTMPNIATKIMKPASTATVVKQYVQPPAQKPSRADVNKVAALRKVQGELLPCEREEKRALEAEIERLADRTLVTPLDKDFRRIDPSFLAMAIEEIYPKFAAFYIETGTLVLGAQSSRYGMGWESIAVPKGSLHEYYRPIISRLVGKGMRISATMPGLIPSSVREKIKANKSRLDEIYVVKEMTKSDWTVKNVPADPMVIGQKGSLFFLLDVFDLTTAEQYIAAEFTT